MSDIFVGLDQELADKLVNSLKIPFTVDALKPRYFETIDELEPLSNERSINQLESDLYNVSLRALKYAETRETEISKEISEDQEIYEIASIAVDAYLSENESELEAGDNLISIEYDFAKQKGLWGRIKKYARRAINWLKRQAKKVFKIRSIKLERFEITVNSKPNIKVSNPVKIYDVDLKINYRVTVKYKLLGLKGRVTLSDKLNFPDTDLNVRFIDNGLKYLAKPEFRRLSIVKYILGFKVTISLSKLVNKKIKPMEIFDAEKHIPNIPWFGKTLKPKPPVKILTYQTDIRFGVNFELDE